MTKPTFPAWATDESGRCGSLKPIDSIRPQSGAILDSLIYDARRGGGGKLVCVIHRGDDLEKTRP